MKLKSALKKAKKVKVNGIMEGELTGHAHRFSGAGTAILELENGQRVLEVKKEARINHEEHQEIKLPMGFHRIHQKRQYTPDGWESVRD